MNDIALGWAKAYARRAWRVLPVWSAAGAKVCTCPKGAECGTPGKHPRIIDWPNTATYDVDQITDWWKRWPDSNIGIATGRASGIVVVDVDLRNEGLKSLAQWEHKTEPLPPTLTAVTGSGGIHYAFTLPADIELKNRVDWLPGVDIRADGGQIVVAPSRHESGMYYAWRDFAVVPANAPDYLLAALIDSPNGRSHNGSKTKLPESIDFVLNGVPEGQRDDVMYRSCCRWREQYKRRSAVQLLALAAARACSPPFPDEDAYKCVEQAFKAYARKPEKNKDVLRSEGTSEHIEDIPGHRRLTDDGNALRLIDHMVDDIRYNSGVGWMVWRDTHWAVDGDDITEKARDVVRNIRNEIVQAVNAGRDSAQVNALTAWARKSEGAYQIKAMIQLASSDPRVTVRTRDLDTDPWLISCRNGTLDLRTGSLRPNERADYITRTLHVDYSPTAECPQWLKFLERVLPEPDTRVFLQRWAGYSLTGLTREKSILVLCGDGDNGKSVLVETMRRVLGDYGAHLNSQALLADRKNGIPSDIAALRGKRLVTAAETDDGARIAVSLIKQVTGGDTISARFLRREWFEFIPECKIWLSTNSVPIITDLGDAAWQRIRILPFDVKIPKHEQIPRDEFEEMFTRESAGILAWAVNGCMAWEKHGLTESAEVMLATATVRQNQDWLTEWMEDTCELRGDYTSLVGDLYQCYFGWATFRGEKPWSSAALTRQLQRRGFIIVHQTVGEGDEQKQIRYWRGITPKVGYTSASGTFPKV